MKVLPTTKLIEDYVQDGILHPIDANYIFSSVEAVNVLNGDFIVVGSSPRFFQDFRWHKSINKSKDESNIKFIDQFNSFAYMLLDDRMQNPKDHNLKDMEYVEALLSKVWDLSCEIFTTSSYEKLEQLISVLKDLNLYMKYISNDIFISINELITALPNISKGVFTDELPNFRSWWGRGLNYLSLRRL